MLLDTTKLLVVEIGKYLVQVHLEPCNWNVFAIVP